VERAVRAALAPPRRPALRCKHTPPGVFHPGQTVPIMVTLPDVPEFVRSVSVRLRYRRVHQAESYREMEMEAEGSRYRAVIPADAADSPYPLQYYFALRDAAGRAWLYPGFAADLCSQPYFVVRQPLPGG
jgi:hypothetical protein